MTEIKSPFRSVGIMGPLVSLIVWATGNFAGFEVSESEVAGVFDSACMIAATVTGMYGRWRATTQVSLKK
jgi:hypothetical protein